MSLYQGRARLGSRNVSPLVGAVALALVAWFALEVSLLLPYLNR